MGIMDQTLRAPVLPVADEEWHGYASLMQLPNQMFWVSVNPRDEIDDVPPPKLFAFGTVPSAKETKKKPASDSSADKRKGTGDQTDRNADKQKPQQHQLQTKSWVDALKKKPDESPTIAAEVPLSEPPPPPKETANHTKTAKAEVKATDTAAGGGASGSGGGSGGGGGGGGSNTKPNNSPAVKPQTPTTPNVVNVQASPAPAAGKSTTTTTTSANSGNSASAVTGDKGGSGTTGKGNDTNSGASSGGASNKIVSKQVVGNSTITTNEKGVKTVQVNPQQARNSALKAVFGPGVPKVKVVAGKGKPQKVTAPALNNSRHGGRDGRNAEFQAEINPKIFDCPKSAKMFVIKSYSEDDVHKSIKYGVWASTESGNKRLSAAWNEASQHGARQPHIFLFFSVNASGQFCGCAQMTSNVDTKQKLDYWADDKWSGKFTVKWIYIKDIPNTFFRHIILENNENKPVTNSRDTQEIPPEKGKEMVNIFRNFRHKTSIMDDFSFYDQRQKDMEEAKTVLKKKEEKESEGVHGGSTVAPREAKKRGGTTIK
eukprot:TRINITY_DN67179_c8_g3_i1.p1 TRINITY_DN67179_c8_g3~~TRINITY_DN67179_c8_g3_i1.p1  ORF type:complete len:542 (+),score=125.15 TRINITY_DN67179_c8_g3_i1:31-1656(+)